MKDFVLMDGGHDSQVIKYVGTQFESHPLWLCWYLHENPDVLRKVCQDYIKCGAEMILSCTYQATVDGFHEHLGLSKEKSLELIKLGVKLAREAVEIETAKGNMKTVTVGGGMGPYGAYLHDGSEYTGASYVDHMTTEALADWHRSRFEALLETAPDFFFFSTIPALKEAEALILLLKENPGTKAFISFSAQNEETISHGEKLSDVAQRCWELAADQILAIGVNCLHPRLVEPLLRSVQQRNPNIPLLAKANSTEIFNTTTKQWETSDNVKTLPEYCRDWLNLGVKYISGCCRTTVQDIASFDKEIKKFINKVD